MTRWPEEPALVCAVNGRRWTDGAGQTAQLGAQIVMGHFIAIFALSMLQLTVMVAQALWTSAVGLFIGVVSKSDEQVTMFSIIPTLLM